LEQREAAAVQERRAVVLKNRSPEPNPSTSLPENCVGLALSGGGIRSATYCLGMLQALAMTKMLRRVDFLSTVSGGGYAGGFLGRLYTQIASALIDKVEHKAEAEGKKVAEQKSEAELKAEAERKAALELKVEAERRIEVERTADRVETILANPRSNEIWWLRQNANYLTAAGRSDLEANIAVIARNFVAIYFCVGTFLLGLLGALRWFSDAVLPAPNAWKITEHISASPWWSVLFFVLLVAVLPLTAAYWLTPAPQSKQPYPPFAVLLWMALLASAIAALDIAELQGLGLLAIVVLLLGWLWQDGVRWSDRSGDPDMPSATLYRNRLTRTLGTVLLIAAGLTVFIVIDSLARSASTTRFGFAMVTTALLGTPLLPFIRKMAIAMIPDLVNPTSGRLASKITVNALAFGFAGILFLGVDIVAHGAFTSHAIGVWVVLAALATSLALGSALNFLNLSSLQQHLTQKLTRTFLGASNDARVHPRGIERPVPIQVSDVSDDVVFSDYHPEKGGGPLHLINVCINQTIDHISGRQLRQNKGLPMCLGPKGITVGRQYHALWQPLDPSRGDNVAEVQALPVAPDPYMFHVLARSDGAKATVEQLSLGRWLAISAAAFTTGAGRVSSLPLSLLLGLLNIRLGYWWDSGIGPGDRPGRYPPDIWQRIKAFPARLFTVQVTLLNEWRDHFEGPKARHWYLSDGGHFENSGTYELIRRRLPFIIAVDASTDRSYEFDDLAILMRQVRLDFGADFFWLDPGGKPQNGGSWDALDAAAMSARNPRAMPDWIKNLIQHPETIGSLSQIKRESRTAAALARISYDDSSEDQNTRVSWLLYIRASLPPDIAVDVRNYAVSHPDFPNQSIFDQFFDDAQWESYRSLGEGAGRAIFEKVEPR
jgi:hypothetical protein